MIDFTELPETPKGEALERLTRAIGAKMSMNPAWTGRGQDGGRDLTFSENQTGPISSQLIRWLVSCKDFARSGRSVGEADVGSVSDKVRQHRAKGFLLVTTTTASTGLKELLDGIDILNGGEIHTKIWDAHELTMILNQEEFLDLFRIYFPDSYASQQRSGETQLALDIVLSNLPQKVAGQVRELVDSHLDRASSLNGPKIWPHDQASAKTIDDIMVALLRDENPLRAAELMNECFIEYDAFLQMVDSLSSRFPSETKMFLTNVIEIATDAAIKLNAFEMIREKFDFTHNLEEVRLAAHLDPEDIAMIYTDQIGHTIETHIFDYGFDLVRRAFKLPSNYPKEKIDIHEICNPVFVGVPGKEKIEFQGAFKGDVQLENTDWQPFEFVYSGFFNVNGLDIELEQGFQDQS